MGKDLVILAYSGGLDTSCILKWLLVKGYDVICYMANVGQEEDFEWATKKAINIGASEVVVDDLRKSFVEDYIWPSVRSGLLYESRYLLGTSIARPCISVGLIKCARERGARYISHGATGKGNDQIRFELSCYYLWPEIKVIAPWRDPEFIARFQGRQDLLKYANENQIPVSATPKEPWSTDANIMHISYESGILENPLNEAPKSLFEMTKSPVDCTLPPFRCEIEFVKGVPSVLNAQGKMFQTPLDILTHLNEIGGAHGVGRIDIVENRFVGLKSRGVYETPGCYVLHVAHTDLEVFCLDKEVYRIKKTLQDKLSDVVYNGLWFSPEGDYLNKCITLSEEVVTGLVKLEIYRGHVAILGRSSPTSIYNEDLVSMDKHSDFDSTDATGFINILSIRLKEYARMQANSK